MKAIASKRPSGAPFQSIGVRKKQFRKLPVAVGAVIYPGRQTGDFA